MKWALLPENLEMYGGVLADIKANYAQISQRNVERQYSSQMQRNSKYIGIAYRLGALFKTYADQDDAGKLAMKTKVTDGIDGMYDGLNMMLEGEMLNSMVNLYQQRVDKETASPSIMGLDAKNLSTLAFSSIFASKESALNFLNNPDRLEAEFS